MYKYDQYDQRQVDTRVEEFRDQTRRRLSGELPEEKFRPLRLMNGLYLQLHAYMLRVAVPYGTLSGAQMHALADIAKRPTNDNRTYEQRPKRSKGPTNIGPGPRYSL